MKLFDFNKEGPGIDPDAPKKTGWALFFDILKREFWNIMKLNFLFLLACIPVLTAGAAYAAMCAVFEKIIEDEPVDVVAHFKTAFVVNWKQATVVYLVALAFVTVTWISLSYYYALYPPVAFLVLGLVLILVMLHNYVVPALVVVDAPLVAIYKHTFLMLCMAPKAGLCTLGATICTFMVGVMLFPLSTGYMVIFGMAFATFVNCFLTHQPIRAWRNLPQVSFEEKEYL